MRPTRVLPHRLEWLAGERQFRCIGHDHSTILTNSALVPYVRAPTPAFRGIVRPRRWLTHSIFCSPMA
jgi:hypothetical protein